MSTPQPIQFAAESYLARSGVVSCQRLVNLYLEATPAGAKGQVALYGTPGLKPWATVGVGPIRGLRYMGGKLFAVSGEHLYTITPSKTITRVGENDGAAVGGVGNVHMADNGTHVAIATSDPLYAATATSITELAVRRACGAAYQDGYGIFPESGSSRVWATALDNMLVISGTSYGTADASTGNVVGCISDHRELTIFKDDSIESWYNAGTSPFAFARIQGAFAEKGCAFGGSVAKHDNRVFFLGADLGVYSLQGYQPQCISTPAIEHMIKGCASPYTAWAFCYRQEGHSFYVLTFSDLTLAYDLTTGLWHERRSYGLGRWRANCYAEAFGRHLVGDFETGGIYELNLDYFTDNGSTIVRQAVTPPLSVAGSPVSMPELYLDMEAGVGLNAGQGSDPVVLLDWSDDGGKTWSAAREAYAGKIGEYARQARWNRLGTFRQRSLRATISDPVKVAIVGAWARMEPRT